MKQHITVEQFNSLSEKGQIQYIKYNRKNYDCDFFLWNIGQMIEFLEKHKKYVTCDQWIKDEYHHWRVGLNWFDKDEYDYICEKPELCDALWMAIKEVLEEK